MSADDSDALQIDRSNLALRLPSSLVTLGGPRVVHVDPKADNVTVIAAPPSDYWQRWWDPKEADTGRENDYRTMFFWSGDPPTSPDKDKAFVEALRVRGLDSGMFAWPIKPEYAKAIAEFRANVANVSRVFVPRNVPAQLEPEFDEEAAWDACAKPDKRLAELQTQRTKLEAERTKLRSDRTVLESKQAELLSSGAKTPDVDPLKDNKAALVANQGKIDHVAAQQDQVSEMKGLDDKARQQRIAAEKATIKVKEQEKVAGHLVDSWQYGGKRATTSDLDAITPQDDFETRFKVSYTIFQTREGGLNAICTWDGTFSFGSGFNLSTGIDHLLPNLLQPPQLTDEQKAAHSDACTFLKRAGIWVEIGSSASGDRAFRPLVVHLEPNSRGETRGWVVAGGAVVHAGSGNKERHPIAFEYVRHSKDILNIFSSVGENNNVPGGTSAHVRRMLAVFGFNAYVANQRSSFRLFRLLATDAGFTYLAHMRAWGGVYVPDMFILFAVLRGYVRRRVVHKDGSVTEGPVSILPAGGDGPPILQAPPAKPPKDYDTVEEGMSFEPIKPSAEIDVRIATATIRWLVTRRPGIVNSDYEWKVGWKLWREFLHDIKDPQLGGYANAIDDPFVPLSKMVDDKVKAASDAGGSLSRVAAEAAIRKEFVVFNKEKVLLDDDLTPGWYVAGSLAEKKEANSMADLPGARDHNFSTLVGKLAPKPT